MLESLHRQCPAAGSKSLALWRRTIRCFEQRNPGLHSGHAVERNPRSSKLVWPDPAASTTRGI